jgi:hypothetical protein
MLKVLYAVVDRTGKFRAFRGNFACARRKTAEGWCRQEGDSVVELVWDTDRQPLYIKRKKVGDGEA